MSDNNILLTVRDIRKVYKKQGEFAALDGVSFTLREGETLGVVGESGSGKTTVAKIVAGITDRTSGQMLYKGQELDIKRSRDLRREIQYIYQEPVSALNPKMTIERILREPLELYFRMGRQESRERIRKLLGEVGLSEEVTRAHPTQLSGGQCQRIGIARALAGNPRLIICDEPTSALDATIQSQILKLMTDLQREKGFSYIFITHNLGVVKYMSDHILVLKGGRIEEEGTVADIFERPQGTYTRTLLSSVPKVDIPYYEVG